MTFRQQLLNIWRVIVAGGSRGLSAAIHRPSESAGDAGLGGGDVKYILLARRKPGMTKEDFKAYYEKHHSKLIFLLVGAPLKRYVRRYLYPQTLLDPSSGEGYDVITELWCDTQDQMDAVMDRFDDPKIGPLFTYDEDKLFDRASFQTYRVEEYETDLSGLSIVAVVESDN